MRRDYISWALALAAGLLLWVGIVWAFTPQELMGERVISPPVCADGKCTLAEDDLRFVMERGRLMEEVATRLYNKLNSCRGGHGA